MPTILHTADLHLGRAFPGVGEVGPRLREILRQTFSRIVDLAVDQKVDLLLVAGDLFDSNAVSPGTVDFVVGEFRRGKIPVCILPGTHDCLDATSVYRRKEAGWPDNVHVLADETSSIAFEDLDLSVHGRPNCSNRGRESPLKGLSPQGGTRWHVAMAHGSVRVPKVVDEQDFPILSQEIESSRFDYIALGHWHSYCDFSWREAKVCYPGSPEGLSFKAKEPGHVLIVELDHGGVQVRRERVGRTIWREMELNVAEFSSAEELWAEIARQKNPDLLLRIKLRGISPADFSIDLDSLVGRLADDFLHLEVMDEVMSSPAVAADAISERTILGQFVRLMEEKIQQTSHGERELLFEALRLGQALLQGNYHK